VCVYPDMNNATMLRRLAVLTLGLVALSTTACKKGPALEELKKVEEACNAKDKEKAIQIALEASKSNSSFQKAFDGVFEKVDDKSKANVCGGINLIELKSRIENGPAI
jgi:hypothetical protein